MANVIEKVKTFVGSRKNKLVKAKVVKGDRTLLWGKIGFALGIAGATFMVSPLIGAVICIPGLVFNILGLRAEKGRWYAVAGLTLSIVFLNLAFA